MQQEKTVRKELNGLTRVNVGRVTDGLKAMRDRDKWKVIIPLTRLQCI